MYTAWFIGEPLSGCTLACSARNKRLARSMAEHLDAVGELLAAVVAAAGIAFGVLVGEHRAVGRVDLGEGVVLGRNQLEAFALAVFLADARRRRRRDRMTATSRMRSAWRRSW